MIRVRLLSLSEHPTIGSIRLLLPSAGIKNASIHDAEPFRGMVTTLSASRAERARTDPHPPRFRRARARTVHRNRIGRCSVQRMLARAAADGALLLLLLLPLVVVITDRPLISGHAPFVLPESRPFQWGGRDFTTKREFRSFLTAR